MCKSKCLIVVLLSFAGLSRSQADDFTIDLQASAGKQIKKAEAFTPAPDKKPSPRAILMIDVDAPVTVKWAVRNTGKTTMKDILVHVFVVKEDKLDQQEVPKLTKNVIAESALTMDFKTQDKTDGEITFRVGARGPYLLRLELKNAADKDWRAPFAALDLDVR